MCWKKLSQDNEEELFEGWINCSMTLGCVISEQQNQAQTKIECVLEDVLKGPISRHWIRFLWRHNVLFNVTWPQHYWTTLSQHKAEFNVLVDNVLKKLLQDNEEELFEGSINCSITLGCEISEQQNQAQNKFECVLEDVLKGPITRH